MYAPLVIVGGSAANLLIAGMFVARVVAPSWAAPLGFAGTAMAIPLAAASVVAVRDGASIWDIVLPLVFVAYAVLEVLLDGVLHVAFRSTAWLGPYLLLYYAGQWAIIGRRSAPHARAGSWSSSPTSSVLPPRSSRTLGWGTPSRSARRTTQR